MGSDISSDFVTIAICNKGHGGFIGDQPINGSSIDFQLNLNYIINSI